MERRARTIASVLLFALIALVRSFTPISEKATLKNGKRRNPSELWARSSQWTFDVARKMDSDRPTATEFGRDGPSTAPSKPKIVVLGASGKVGRLCVQKLMESNVDCTVVAFVRNRDKATRVLYDDMVAAVNTQRRKGPQLQIVEGDLVPPEELPGYRDIEEEAEFKARAQSAASFFGKKVKDFDNRDDSNIICPNEALEEAVKGCTAIISCVGASLPPHPLTMILSWPFWRLLRSDVRGWCKDRNHPFYITFRSTKKALDLAEQEQRRREPTIGQGNSSSRAKGSAQSTPRIRFVRISDLDLTNKPWNFISMTKNIMCSMILRYHGMADNLLEASELIDTVVIRTGEMVDTERDIETTTVQVSATGSLPSPSRVGREDVADLLVAASLFDSKAASKQSRKTADNEAPFHYTLAVRWTGGPLEPYPKLGRKEEGMPTAKQSLVKALDWYRKTGKPRNRADRKRLRRRKCRKMKPYGICVLPLYLFPTLLLWRVVLDLVPHLPQSVVSSPLLGWIQGVAATILAQVTIRFRSLFQGNIPIFRWLSRQPTRNYISF